MSNTNFLMSYIRIIAERVQYSPGSPAVSRDVLVFLSCVNDVVSCIDKTANSYHMLIHMIICFCQTNIQRLYYQHKAKLLISVLLLLPVAKKFSLHLITEITSFETSKKLKTISDFQHHLH